MDKPHLSADALGDFAEGLLPPADRREAEAHLALCADCRREAAAMQAYFREMSGLGTLKAPDRFLTKVHGRIAQASPWRRLLAALSSPRLLPVPLMGLAVILVGVYFAFLSPRLAGQALPESQAAAAAPSPPDPGPVARLAKKPMAPEASEPLQAGSSGEAPAEPPAQVAMAPAKAAPEPEKRLAKALSNRSDRAPRQAAPVPSRPEVGSAKSAPVETEALAMAEADGPAQGRAETKAKSREAGGLAGRKDEDGHKERKASEAEGLSDLSSVYILDNSPPPGSDAVADRMGSSPGPAALLEDAPPALAREESARRSAPAAAAPPAVTAKPWAPLGYTLQSRIGEAALRGGLAKLGIRILRREEARGRSYELEVPAARVQDLEAYLGGIGSLTPSPRPLPGKPGANPLLLTLRVIAP